MNRPDLGLSEAEKRRLYVPTCDCKFCQRYRDEHPDTRSKEAT
jgi:hypothetical protein